EPCSPNRPWPGWASGFWSSASGSWASLVRGVRGSVMQISFRRRNAWRTSRFDLDRRWRNREEAGMRTFLLLALLIAAVPAQARLSREEQAMTATVDRETDRTIALLERMVNRNSGTLNLEGVTAVGEMVRAELAPLGFDVRWVDMRATGRAGH